MLKDGSIDKIEAGSYHELIHSVLKNYQLASPIPKEMQGLERIRDFYKGSKWIPFSGYRSDPNDALLNYFINLAKLSPTLSSCINWYKKYGFGRKITFAEDEDTQFDISNTKDVLSLVSDTDNIRKKAFAKQLTKINLSGITWNKLSESLFESRKRIGNAYYLVKITKAFDGFYPSIKYLQPHECRYSVPENILDRKISISPVWDPMYINTYGYNEYPVYPLYEETKDAITTIFHIKEGDDSFYGRPDWLGCNLQAFNEVKASEYLLKALHNDFIGLFILEMESEEADDLASDEDAKKSGYQNAIDRIEKMYTVKGSNPSSAVVMTRPPGATPFTMAQVPPNTKDRFYDFLFKSDKEYIAMVNNCSLKLLGVTSAGGFSNTAYVDEFLTKLPFIETYQQEIDLSLNMALDFIAEKTGEPYNDYNLKQQNPFEIIVQMQAKRDVVTRQMQNQQQQQQTPDPANDPADPQDPPADPNSDPNPNDGIIIHKSDWNLGRLWRKKNSVENDFIKNR